jgi:AAA+ ATPase superfamily predicted ATPase
MFIGREYELNLMIEFKKRNTAGLIVCRGRRRIGKSTLIQQFGKKFDSFYEFYGLAPRDKMTLNDQLKNFSELFTQYFGVNIRFNNWTDAFSTLAEFTSKGNVLILLDEISWMGSKDKDFAGKLKGIWDTKFKKNRKLILVLCGSVSSWINKNILNDKGFLGRVSLTITLDELPLSDAHQFWSKNKRISSYEKFKLLSITGGVPRYLEEIIPSLSAEQNIKRMCFSKEGFLFTEFDKIFKDIFYNKYAAMLLFLLDRIY